MICFEYFNARNRGGLSDVVQQRCPAQHQVGTLVLQGDRLPQHGQRMLVDVLVLVMLVDRHLHVADVGQHHVAQPGLHHQFDTGDRIGAQQQLVQLGRDPLGGDPAQLGGHVLDR